MITLLKIYSVTQGPIHKRLRAKIKVDNKIRSVWCGTQVGDYSVNLIDARNNVIQMASKSSVIRFGAYTTESRIRYV